MAFGPRSNTHIAKYSKLLGQIYLESEAAKSVLGAVPDEVKRAGFNDKTSRELCKQIQDGGGLLDSSLEGDLIYFDIGRSKDVYKDVKRKDIKKFIRFIGMGIRTGLPKDYCQEIDSPSAKETKTIPVDEVELKPAVILLWVPLKSAEGLSLMHKLANAQFGGNTKLSMFAQMKEGKDGRMYGNHFVGLKQNGETVKPMLPFPDEERETMRAKLKADGKDDYVIHRELLKVEYKKTLPQIEKVRERFNHYRISMMRELVNKPDERTELSMFAQMKEDGYGVDTDSHEAALPNEAAAQDDGVQAQRNDTRLNDLQSA